MITCLIFMSLEYVSFSFYCRYDHPKFFCSSFPFESVRVINQFELYISSILLLFWFECSLLALPHGMGVCSMQLIR